MSRDDRKEEIAAYTTMLLISALVIYLAVMLISRL
jgi:hypothetical protein